VSGSNNVTAGTHTPEGGTVGAMVKTEGERGKYKVLVVREEKEYKDGTCCDIKKIIIMILRNIESAADVKRPGKRGV